MNSIKFFVLMLPLKCERCVSHKCIYSIDNYTKNQIIFYIRNGREGKGQDSRETERERGRENERWAAAGIVWVVKRTVRKYTCLINKMANIWNNCY